MRQRLIASLEHRMSNELVGQNPVSFIKKIPVSELVDISVINILLYTRGGKGKATIAIMSELVSAIGHMVRSKYKLKRNSAIAAKTGAFLLWSFEDAKIVRTFLGESSGKHATFLVEIVDNDTLSQLWDNISIEKVEKLPTLEPPDDWVTTRHSTEHQMVKTNDKEILSMTKETHPIVFNTLNKAQRIGWTVNEDILPIFVWALRNKTKAFNDIWEIQSSESKNSKIREARAVIGVAKRFIGKVFYHMYTYDFRGRKYCFTSFFNEQGTDGSKGILLLAEKRPIGEQGFFWLCISIANSWAGDAGRADGRKTDKIPLNDRVTWVLDNEEIFLSYVENPKVNQGWMDADKPWQFLAACFELARARDYERSTDDLFGYQSGFVCYIDGSTNGSQHLACLSKDEVVAPHVNIVPNDLPGDLYSYVADHVWEVVNQQYDNIGKHEVKELEKLVDNIIDLKKQISDAPPKSDRRKELVTQIQKLKEIQKESLDKSSVVFWHRITDKKHRRKIVKRGVMTIPYGGTSYGLGQQVIDDARKHGIDLLMSMEHKWGAYMGRLIYEDAKVSLKRPMKILSVFEKAGKKAESEERFLKWNVPITNFPVIQHYTEGLVKKTWIQYGPPKGPRLSTGNFENTLQLHICFIEERVPSKRKQQQGASPNIIHSLDAAHLMLTVNACDFPVVTVHDSYGCHLGNMSDLYCIVREQFVKLYEADPLMSILTQTQSDISELDIGNLDIKGIIDSEFCFA